MATVTQTGYIISSPSGISCGLRGVKVYLSIDELGRIGEYKQPVEATFIPNQCELNKKLKIAQRWYCNLSIFATKIQISTSEPAQPASTPKIVTYDTVIEKDITESEEKSSKPSVTTTVTNSTTTKTVKK